MLPSIHLNHQSVLCIIDWDINAAVAAVGSVGVNIVVTVDIVVAVAVVGVNIVVTVDNYLLWPSINTTNNSQPTTAPNQSLPPSTANQQQKGGVF